MVATSALWCSPWSRSARASAPRAIVHLLLGAVAATLLSGCVRGFTRAETGAACKLGGRDGHSGQAFSVDTVIDVDPKTAKWIDGGQLPFAIHVTGTAILAPERKVFAFGTGLAYYGPPRPISGYLLGGTTIHFDEIDRRFSFGNASPYGEVGLLTSVPAGLATGNEVDGFRLIKLGVGWAVD